MEWAPGHTCICKIKSKFINLNYLVKISLYHLIRILQVFLQIHSHDHSQCIYILYTKYLRSSHSPWKHFIPHQNSLKWALHVMLTLIIPLKSSLANSKEQCFVKTTLRRKFATSVYPAIADVIMESHYWEIAVITVRHWLQPKVKATIGISAQDSRS